MKPVQQDRFGPEVGTCFPACVASILEVPIGTIPNFNMWENVFDRWNFAAQVWLGKEGWDLSDAWVYEFAVENNIYGENEIVIASGLSNRDIQHAVLWKGKELVFDPYPRGKGLIGDPHNIMTLRKKGERNEV